MLIPIVSIVATLLVVFAALWIFTDVFPFGSNSGYSGESSSRRDREDDDDRDRDRDRGDNGDNGDNNGDNGSSGSSGDGGNNGDSNGGDGDNATAPAGQGIVGSWVADMDGAIANITFGADGRFFMVFSFPGGEPGVVSVHEGTYAVSGNSLTVTPTFGALYNHLRNEILDTFDADDPDTSEFSISGNTMTVRDPDGVEEDMVLTVSQPSANWSFSHRANANTAQTPTPPANAGPSLVTETYVRILSGDSFFIGFKAGMHEFEFYFHDDRLAINMDDPSIGQMTIIMGNDGIVAINRSDEYYVEFDLATALEAFGEEYFRGIEVMTDGIIDSMVGMTYTQSGSGSFQGETLPYDEFMRRNGDRIQVFYDRDMVVGVKNYIGRISEDIIIHGYSTLTAQQASGVFNIPRHYQRIVL